jgi:hypothetical protein
MKRAPRLRALPELTMTMRKILLSLLVSAALGAAVVAQAGKIQSTGHPLEMSTDALILAGDLNGRITVGARTFQLTANTTYSIGDRFVTFAEFSKFLQGLNGRPPHNGVVVLTLDLKQVTSVSVAANAASK